MVPMLRHVKDQPELEEMDGPLAMIMAPTRELAIQVRTIYARWSFLNVKMIILTSQAQDKQRDDRYILEQLFNVVKLFTKTLEIRAACVYGGAGVAEQIGMLKFGVHVIVCTPGRMIDLLCANSGRVTNLRRVTYICLDEADRMFDMGFEPQIMKIIANTRPDRQTVLFSATFPPQVEALAKQVLERPIEITVGGRSVRRKRRCWSTLKVSIVI